MIIRILMTAMIVLAIAKYYLHDTKQTEQIIPVQQVEDIQMQLDESLRKHSEQEKRSLDALER